MAQVLTVVSPFRGWGASYRVRVQAWLDRTGQPHRAVGPDRPDHSRGDRGLTPGDVAYELAVRRPRRRIDGRLLVQKEASRFGNGDLERRLVEAADDAVLDVDDAVHIPRPSRGPALLGQRWRRAQAVMQSVDRVVAGNAFLAEAASAWCRDVVVVPTCVDPVEYDAPRPRTDPDAPIVVGWLGSQGSEPYLDGIWPLLARVQRDTGIVVRVVGTRGPSVEVVEGCRVERRAWSLDTQASDLASFDIGLIPLPDSPFERGKCGYKALQYGAAGIAAIGDPVGVSGAILEAAGNPAPTSPTAWEDDLRALVASATERGRLAASLRQHVLDHFTYAVWQDRWVDAVTG